jgi:hypothetical protein
MDRQVCRLGVDDGRDDLGLGIHLGINGNGSEIPAVRLSPTLRLE